MSKAGKRFLLLRLALHFFGFLLAVRKRIMFIWFSQKADKRNKLPGNEKKKLKVGVIPTDLLTN